MSMTVRYLDKKEKEIAKYSNVACFASIPRYSPKNAVYFDFLLYKSKEESEPASHTFVYPSWCTVESLATDEERKRWIDNVFSLYNFREISHTIEEKGKYVRFDLTKVSAPMIFAICTCLRYYTEWAKKIEVIYEIEKRLVIPFKEAFIWSHLMQSYPSGHHLLSPNSSYNACISVVGMPMTLDAMRLDNKGQRVFFQEASLFATFSPSDPLVSSTKGSEKNRILNSILDQNKKMFMVLCKKAHVEMSQFEFE